MSGRGGAPVSAISSWLTCGARELRSNSRLGSSFYRLRVAKRAKTLQVKAVAFSQLVQDRPPRWPTPMRQLMKDPGKGDFV